MAPQLPSESCNHHRDEQKGIIHKYPNGTIQWDPIREAARTGMRLPLFVKKHNDEGTEFYYLGEVSCIDNRIEEQKMSSSDGNQVSVVQFDFLLDEPVETNLYRYLTRNEQIG